MKNSLLKCILIGFALSFGVGCGIGDSSHLNNNPNDLGMPDSPTISDSPRPGQPNGYAPAGSNKKDSSGGSAIDSTTKGTYQ